MKIFKELESLGFFEWLEEIHNVRDTDMKPEYLDGLPLDDIHRTVGNSMALKWFRENHNLFGTIGVDQTMEPKFYYSISIYESTQFLEGWHNHEEPSHLYYTYEKAEDACIDKLIDLVRKQQQ